MSQPSTHSGFSSTAKVLSSKLWHPLNLFLFSGIILISTLLVFLLQIQISNPAAPGDEGWVWQHPFPQGNNLNDITCISSSSLCFAVGEAGTLLTWQGASWGLQTQFVTNLAINSVACIPGTAHCFAVGNSSLILEYNAGSWAVITSPIQLPYAPAALYSVTCYSATLCMVVGANRAVLYYDGTSWQVVEAELAPPPGAIVPAHTVGRADLYGISCVSETRCFAVGFDKIYDYKFDANLAAKWAGTVLFDLDEGTLFDISCPDAEHCEAVGYGGEIWGYDGTPGGSGWTRTVDSTTSTRLQGVYCLSASDCYAVGEAGEILAYDGTAWTPLTSPTSKKISSVFCLTPTSCLAVGNNGVLLTKTQSTWSLLSTQLTSANLNAVFCPSPIKCFAAGDQGALLSYDGYNWVAATSNTSVNLLGIGCSSAFECWAVGESGTLLGYTGHNWQVANSPTNVILRSVSCPVSGKCFAVGDSSTILAYSNGVWTKITSPDTNNRRLYSVSCPAAGVCFAVGENHTILAYSNSVWSVASTSGQNDKLFSISCANVTHCYATGGANLFASYNGTTWADSSLPDSSFYPLSLSCPQVDICTVVGQGKPGTVLNFKNGNWTSQSSGSSNPLLGIHCPNNLNCITTGGYASILARQSYLVVTNPDDVTNPGLNGTLSYAFSHTVAGQVIKFKLSSGNTITVGATLPNLPGGVTINGGCNSRPGITLGSANNKTALSLSGGVSLYGLYIYGKLSATSGDNRAACVTVTS